jgi:hypothetical protein
VFWAVGVKKILCIPLCAELHEGVEALRRFQQKTAPLVDGQPKVSITSLMAAMAAELVPALGRRCLLVLDAYFAVGPVFAILKSVRDAAGLRLVHVVTRAKNNVVAYADAPPKTGRRGRPRKYGEKLALSELFNTHRASFEQARIELYGQVKTVAFLCLDLLWKPIDEKARFVLVADGAERFILMGSDLTLGARDMILAYSYRFKIEVTFKVLKHLMGAFFYRFWTHAWPRIGKASNSDLSAVNDKRRQRLIGQTTDAIEAFVNFGCIATGILQILALSCHKTIWQRYRGWLRTVSSSIPSEEVVQSVVQQEYYQNFRNFRTDAIYRIIMSKNRGSQYDWMPLAA